MSNFNSIFREAGTQEELQDELNLALNTHAIAQFRSASLEHTSSGSNKVGLVFATQTSSQTGVKLQCVLLKASSMSKLKDKIELWIKGNDFKFYQIAIGYGSGDNRTMLIYNPDQKEIGYTVHAISADKAIEMEAQVDAAVNGKSEVVADSTFANSKFRAVLITTKP